MSWNSDPKIEASRKHPGWVSFHRECGKLNFYIDRIEKAERQYSATAFRLRDRLAPPYVMFPMEQGRGKTPIEACIDAYRKAIDVGHMANTHLERLFDEDDEDLIGLAPVAETPAELEDDEDLIG